MAVAAVLASATLAYAHGTLRRSAPAKGQHLSVAPNEVRLTFTEAVELSLARVALAGPNGPVELGALSLADSGMVLTAPITGRLVAGSYTVQWQIAGADGHPVRGEFGFFIAPGAAGVAAGSGSVSADLATHHDPTTFPQSGGFSAESPAYALIRWLTFIAVLGVIGAVAFRAVLGIVRWQASPAGELLLSPAARGAAGLGAIMALASLVLAAARLIAQSVALHGAGSAFDAMLVSTMLTRTVWGSGWILQLVGSLVALAGFWMARRHSAGWPIAAVGALALGVSPALSGHAASVTQYRPLPILADTLHVVGASGWLGSLLVLLIVGIPVALRLEANRAAAVAALVNAFSPTALVFAGLTVGTGVFAAWLHLGSVSALWESGYGRTLLLKLAALTGVFATGAYNWLRVKPTLGQEVATSRLRRSATAEIVVGVLVLAITAVLVASGTPATMAEGEEAISSSVDP
jgi:copper transport protein